MSKRKTSIDGIIKRREPFAGKNFKLGGERNPKSKPSVKKRVRTANQLKKIPSLKKIPAQQYEISEEARLDLNQENGRPIKQSFWARRKARKLEKLPQKKSRKKIKLIILVGLILSLALGGFVAFKVFWVSGSIFQGSFLQVFQSTPLKQDKSGRSNFLILGTSEDDPGHEGANLTDSMMIVSVDQNNKDAYIFSIPRDLYVKYDRLCFSGQSGKINAYLYCVNDEETVAAEQERLMMSMEFIGDIFGLELHYAVRVNYTVLKEAVDAVGGVDVDIQGSGGAPGILDRHFDHVCDYKCYLVKYDNGIHHLDGSQALNLARVRGESAPTYGLMRSNFDREINQQKILVALKDKAVKTSTIMDFNKVVKLIDALGNNLRTNIQTKELRTLLELGREISSDKVYRLSLIGDGDDLAVLKTDEGNVVPVAGYFNYDDIRKFIQKKLGPQTIELEESVVDIFNNSSVPGLAQSEANRLSELGFIIGTISNLPDSANHESAEGVQIYSFGADKNVSAKKLKELYKTGLVSSRPDFLTDSVADFAIIIHQSPDN